MKSLSLELEGLIVDMCGEGGLPEGWAAMGDLERMRYARGRVTGLLGRGGGEEGKGEEEEEGASLFGGSRQGRGQRTRQDGCGGSSRFEEGREEGEGERAREEALVQERVREWVQLAEKQAMQVKPRGVVPGDTRVSSPSFPAFVSFVNFFLLQIQSKDSMVDRLASLVEQARREKEIAGRIILEWAQLRVSAPLRMHAFASWSMRVSARR
jgi:hypothetical protein